MRSPDVCICGHPGVSFVSETSSSYCDRLHREVEAFVKYMSPTPIEDELRSLTVQLISNAIVKSYRDAQVMPFGSYETKLYLPLGCAIRGQVLFRN